MNGKDGLNHGLRRVYKEKPGSVARTGRECQSGPVAAPHECRGETGEEKPLGDRGRMLYTLTTQLEKSDGEEI
jgi:hypothetical protein